MSSTNTLPTRLEDCESTEQLVAFFQAHPNVTVYEGDVGNVAVLKDLVKDFSACLALWGSTRRSKMSDLWTKSVDDDDPTHAKQVNYQGVCNLIQACEESAASSSSGTQCKRIVRITGKGEDPTSFFSVLINLLVKLLQQGFFATGPLRHCLRRGGQPKGLTPADRGKVGSLGTNFLTDCIEYHLNGHSNQHHQQ